MRFGTITAIALFALNAEARRGPRGKMAYCKDDRSDENDTKNIHMRVIASKRGGVRGWG